MPKTERSKLKKIIEKDLIHIPVKRMGKFVGWIVFNKNMRIRLCQE